MKILVTNDDGYKAKGLEALIGVLRGYGELTIVAPKKAQSGMSMAVTMGYHPIAVRKLEERPGERWWYLDGTPASCVKYGLDNIFWPDRPDLVVSGVNHGSNAATASIYSGTVGAAMEGAVNGIPSIALSLDKFAEDADFSVVSELLPSVLDKLLPNMDNSFGTFYNINFPYIPASEVKGIKICTMGIGHWEKEYVPYGPDFLKSRNFTPSEEDVRYMEAIEDGEEVVVMAGDFVSNPGNPEDADHLLLNQGWITVTPENINNTLKEEKKRLCDIIL